AARRRSLFPMKCPWSPRRTAIAAHWRSVRTSSSTASAPRTAALPQRASASARTGRCRQSDGQDAAPGGRETNHATDHARDRSMTIARRCTCCSIVPPAVLRHIARTGTAPQREAALATLATDATHRLSRATTQLLERDVRHSRLTAAPATKQRTIYNANHRTALPGKVMRNEGDGKTKDAEADEAFDGLGTT